MQSDTELGWLISYAFMEIGESAVDELLKATGDDSFCLTRNLVILQMGDKAIDTLHQRALNKRNTTLRYNAIALLGELGRLTNQLLVRQPQPARWHRINGIDEAVRSQE